MIVELAGFSVSRRRLFPKPDLKRVLSLLLSPIRNHNQVRKWLDGTITKVNHGDLAAINTPSELSAEHETLRFRRCPLNDWESWVCWNVQIIVIPGIDLDLLVVRWLSHGEHAL